ncbi:Uncharacterised protein [Vibrio cholerae]|nr:Uncharacterised protein [Vibrio cholerae]
MWLTSSITRVSFLLSFRGNRICCITFTKNQGIRFFINGAQHRFKFGHHLVEFS